MSGRSESVMKCSVMRRERQNRVFYLSFILVASEPDLLKVQQQHLSLQTFFILEGSISQAMGSLDTEAKKIYIIFINILYIKIYQFGPPYLLLKTQNSCDCSCFGT